MDTANDFAVAQTNKLLGLLILNISRCIKSRTPGGVDDLRVATRRFTQPLIAFKHCFPAKESKKTRRTLKRILAAADDVRNYDIAARLVSRFVTAGQRVLLGRLREKRRQADQNLAVLLKRRLDTKWRSRLLGSPVGQRSFCSDQTWDVARRLITPLTKDFVKHGNRTAGPSSSLKELHRFQFVAKKLRDTLELFAPLCDSKLRSTLERFNAIQALLDDISDCATTRIMLSQLGTDRDMDAR